MGIRDSERGIALVANHSTHFASELREHLMHNVHWKTVGIQLLVGLCLLAVAPRLPETPATTPRCTPWWSSLALPFVLR